eukprot:GDKK01051239.1.p1 GENE.GDKK01051239.1~~GDKK01051239.1.p1  ORF type:complete len:528 (-),score=127.11 GDKK01051239.1:741-2324(-)
MSSCSVVPYSVKDLNPHPENRIIKISSIDEYYKVGRELGKGYSATVYDAVEIATGANAALKKIAKERQLSIARESYFRDVYNYLWQIPYDHSVRVQNVLEDEKHFYVAVDKCEGVDLVQFVLKFPPGSIPIVIVQKIMRALLKSVNHLHAHQLLHRDIKLDNVILRSPENKELSNVDATLIDYDMCMFLNRPDLPKEPVKGKVSVVGTREYMAPESYRGIYLPQSDLWSCGVILYLVMDGHFPFDLVNVKDHSEARQIVLKGVKKPTKMIESHKDACDLIFKLLEPDFKKRIATAAEALAHPFISSDLGDGPDYVGLYMVDNKHLFPHFQAHKDVLEKTIRQIGVVNSHKKESTLSSSQQSLDNATIAAQTQANLQQLAQQKMIGSIPSEPPVGMTNGSSTNGVSSSMRMHNSSFKPSVDTHANHHHGQYAYTTSQSTSREKILQQHQQAAGAVSNNPYTLPQTPSSGAISKRQYSGAPHVVLSYNEAVVSGVTAARQHSRPASGSSTPTGGSSKKISSSGEAVGDE